MKFIKRDKTKGSLTNDIRGASGIVSNNSSGNSSTTLESHRIWGQLFDGTNDVTGDMQNVGSITATGNIQTDESVIIKQLDADGNEVEGGDLTISVEDKKAKFSGKDQYVFDRAIEGTDIKANGNLNVTGASTMNGVTVNGDAAFNKNIEVKGQSNLTNVTSTNITNSDTIKTKNLEVTGSAHFFELIIDKIKAAGGAVLFTPANGFKVDIVESVTDGYKLYWQADDGSGNQADNMWKVNDQALCMSFNQAKEGTNHNISNKYYWSLVTAVSDTNQPVSIEEKKYHYIVISTVTKDGTVNPEIGDTIAMLGYRGTDDKKRQSAIYISAYTSLDKGLTAPLLAQYQGINDFNLESHRKSYFDAVSAKFVGNFEVSNGQTIEDYINNKITDSVASIKLDTKNIVLSVSEKTKERRNLLKGTTFHRQLDNFTISSTARIEMNSGYNGTNCIKVIDDTDGNSHYVGVYWDGSQGGRSVKIEKGKKYTISCYYKTNDRNAKFSLEAIYTNKGTNAERLGRPKYLSPSYFNPKYNQWELFTTVIDTTDAESDYIAFNFWEYCNVDAGRINAYICRPMVEEGDTYSGWTLSKDDYDIIGANLIDNSRTFQVGGNILSVTGNKTLVGDVYELTASGSDDYNQLYRIKGDAFKLNTDYTLSFEVRGDAKYLQVNAFYPANNTKYTCYREQQNDLMYETAGDGTTVAYAILGEFEVLSKQQKVWVHFRFKDRLPEQIYFQFTKNSEQTGVTSWSVTITRPKIEVGAVVTEYTERKSDLIDKASLKAAGIEITSDMVELYGNQVKVSGAKGGTPVAMFENGMLNSNLINADKIMARQLQTTGSNGQSVSIENGLMEVFGTNGRCNIKFGVNSNGEAILSYYDKDGKWLYDLGPNKLDGGQLTESTLDGDKYVTAASFFGTNDFFSLKTYINVTVKQVDREYSQSLFGNNLFSNDDQEIANNNSAHIGYQPFARVSNVTTLYRYTAPRQSGTIIKDERYGLTTPALAKQADGKYFTSNSVLATNGKLTNLAPAGYYFRQSVQVMMAPYPMPSAVTQPVRFPAYSIRWLNITSDSTGAVMSGYNAMMSYLMRTIKIQN